MKGLEEDSRIALDPDKSETDVEDKGGEDDAEECHKAKAIRQPQEPTRQEIEEHELTHVPFREWCFSTVARERPATTHIRSTRTK